MKIAVSNIAWNADEESQAAALLERNGVDAVEVAPGKICVNPAAATPADAATYRAFWERHGIKIVAMQALLFGHPELTIFADAAVRKQTLAYLTRIIHLAEMLGARALVFGSPKNRLVGNLRPDEIRMTAVDFFGRLGEVAAPRGVVVCVEPNPVVYGADFINTVTEAIDLVQAVNHPGFGVHLDAGGMALTNDHDTATIARSQPHHFHISEPQLAPVGPSATPHAFFAEQLRRNGYGGYCSIEMRRPDGDWRAGLKSAVSFAMLTYGS